MGLDKKARAELKAKKDRKRRAYRRKLKEEVRMMDGSTNLVDMRENFCKRDH